MGGNSLLGTRTLFSFQQERLGTSASPLSGAAINALGTQAFTPLSSSCHGNFMKRVGHPSPPAPLLC